MNQELAKLLAAAKIKVKSMPPGEIKSMLAIQRDSYVKAEMAADLGTRKTLKPL